MAELSAEEKHQRKIQVLKESMDRLRLSFDKIDFKYREQIELGQSDDGNVRVQPYWEKQMQEIECLRELLKHDLSSTHIDRSLLACLIDCLLIAPSRRQLGTRYRCECRSRSAIPRPTAVPTPNLALVHSLSQPPADICRRVPTVFLTLVAIMPPRYPDQALTVSVKPGSTAILFEQPLDISPLEALVAQKLEHVVMDAVLLPLWHLAKEWVEQAITSEMLEQVYSPPESQAANANAGGVTAHQSLGRFFDWNYSVLSVESLAVWA